MDKAQIFVDVPASCVPHRHSSEHSLLIFTQKICFKRYLLECAAGNFHLPVQVLLLLSKVPQLLPYE